MKIIVDKETGLYLRLDDNHDKTKEIALEMQIVQGFWKPRWNGTSWEEGATQEYIDSLKAQVEIEVEPTLDEMNRADIDYLAIMMEVDL